MKAEAIKEFVDQTVKPVAIGDHILIPPDWDAKHTNELLKHPPLPQAGPAAASLQVSTLGAVREYLKTNRDQLDLSKVMVHVQTPNRVTVGSVLRTPARDREVFITATAVDMTEGFVGRWLALDEFNVGLQTRFLPPVSDDDVTNQRNGLIRLASAVRIEQSAEATDNGISQSLEARAGVVMKSHAELPNPVNLTPFRTFRDILQPSSAFVLRAQAKEGQLPTLCLFEADGGSWKLIAMQRIHDWLCLFEADGGSWKLIAMQRIHDWLKTELGALDIAILA